MALNQDDLKQILEIGRESLNTELKPWLDPMSEIGKSIIAKACIALRNADGGTLVIGMGDDGKADNRTKYPDVRKRFHHDDIQQIVWKFSSEPFEITIHFVEFDGEERVLIEVPAGLRTPVVCRNNLSFQKPGEPQPLSLLQKGAVYVRTLNTNGTPSSAPAEVAADWSQIMERCFNNREADIGAFIRRQLSGLDFESTSSALFEILKSSKAPTPSEAADEFLDTGYRKYLDRKKLLKTQPPTTGIREISAIIVGDFKHPDLNSEFLFRLGRVPRYSGWPPFVSLMNADSEFAETSHDETGVESLEYVNSRFHSLDFSRMESAGKFYYLEALRDDLVREINPREQLEFVIETARVTEVMAIVLLFAKSFCGNEGTNEVSFSFRWQGLAGRFLTSWAHPNRGFTARKPATSDSITTHVTVPISVATNAIGLHVESVMKPLFRLFGGWQFESSVIQDIVTERLKQRL